jgi:uncharacterized protein YcbK (DUF882 family)
MKTAKSDTSSGDIVGQATCWRGTWYSEDVIFTPQEVPTLKYCALFSVVTLLAGSVLLAIAPSPQPSEHRLRMYHTHTGEHLDVVYRRGSSYDAEALKKLDVFLRDSRTGDVHAFDPRLFDLLSDLTAAAGEPDGEINVVCGYRTPSTNEYLRTHTTGVAKNSLHMQAEAIDIRLPGVETSRMRDLALQLGRGGVGFYPESDFVHVDVGPVRHW